jgi:hypothetical protein
LEQDTATWQEQAHNRRYHLYAERVVLDAFLEVEAQLNGHLLEASERCSPRAKTKRIFCEDAPDDSKVVFNSLAFGCALYLSNCTYDVAVYRKGLK